MTNKQTAVEWLVEQFDLTSNSSIIINVIDQAKEIEQKHIEQAFKDGQYNVLFGKIEHGGYYEKTFKKTVK